MKKKLIVFIGFLILSVACRQSKEIEFTPEEAYYPEASVDADSDPLGGLPVLGRYATFRAQRRITSPFDTALFPPGCPDTAPTLRVRGKLCTG